jgi:hypothetical protein
MSPLVCERVEDAATAISACRTFPVFASAALNELLWLADEGL